MAAKKKKTLKKSPTKKKVAAKKTVKKPSAKPRTGKKAAVKKAVAKKTAVKKTGKKKPASPKTKSIGGKQTPAAKRAASKPKLSKPKTAKPAMARATIKQTAQPKRAISATSTRAANTDTGPTPKRGVARALQNGSRVRVLKGSNVGNNGKVVRHDPYLGTYFITLDSYKNEPAYKELEWGPYFPAELEGVK